MTKAFQLLSIQILGLISLLICQVSMAGTVIEVQSGNELKIVVTNGQLARMNMSADEYAIVDYSKQSVKVVNPKKQQVMVLATDNAAAGNNGTRVRTSVNNIGTGIDVAGYPTQKYVYSANRRSCGVIYGSKQAYQQQGIKELFQAMKTMMDNQRAALGGLAAMVDDCTLADMSLSDHVATIGVPMRYEKNGRVETEIKSIKHGVDLPMNTFAIPAAYKTVIMYDQGASSSRGQAKLQRRKQGMMRPYPQY